MKTEHDVSREMQNAFVDGELDRSDWGRIAEQLGRDESLRAEVCEIRTVKDLVRGAYAAPPQALLAPTHPNEATTGREFSRPGGSLFTRTFGARKVRPWSNDSS